MPRVVITMPAYRAEATVEKTVAAIPPSVADELILVDDASPDRTAEIARSLGISVHVHAQNRGYGGNQKTCYTIALESDADVVVMLHPDYQYEPKSVPLLIAPILAREADMTFGSRFAGLGDPMGGGMPIYRFLGNRLTTTLENLMLGSRFSEMHSGMRAYTRECLLSLPFLGYSEDFGFDTQLMVDAVTSGQRVVEVPIPTRYTKESSSISIAKSLKYVGHSLLHTAQQSARRGRRGRRYPVAATGPRAETPARTRRVWRRGSGGATRRVLPPDVALDAVASYVIGGNRVLQVDASGTVAAGGVDPRWKAVDGADLAAGERFDVGIVLDPVSALSDPLQTLRSLRGTIADDGIVALSSTGGGSLRQMRGDAGSLGALLLEAGFRMVQWGPLRGADHAALVLARPVAR